MRMQYRTFAWIIKIYVYLSPESKEKQSTLNYPRQLEEKSISPFDICYSFNAISISATLADLNLTQT